MCHLYTVKGFVERRELGFGRCFPCPFRRPRSKLGDTGALGLAAFDGGGVCKPWPWPC